MRISVVFVLALFLAASEAHVLFTHNLPYTYYNPYALGYSYFNTPVVHPYAYGLPLRHHHPDHKGDGTEDEKQPDSNSKQPAELETPTTIIPANVPENTAALKQYTFSYPVVYTIPTPLSWPKATQFHRQDELGQYHYGYANDLSAKQEIRTLDGITRGSYSYVDSNDKLQTVDYVSDSLGFRVAATNLPKQPKPVEIADSEEIRAAKENHFRAQKEALDRLAQSNLEQATETRENASNVVS